MIKQFTKIFKVLNSDKDPKEIALAASLGLFAAYLSAEPFNFFVVVLFLAFFAANISFFFLSAAIFKIFAVLTDPLADIIGYAVLKFDPLKGIFTAMNNTPFVPLTGFNNTIVMGSFIIAAVLCVPVYIGTVKFVGFYREKLQAAVNKLKVVQAFKLTGLYRFFSEE